MSYSYEGGIFRKTEREASDEERRRVHMDAQSLSFYADISARLRTVVPSGTYTLVDIGPRTGAGLALLRLLHHPLSYSGTKFDPVTGIDLDPMFKQVSAALYPDISAMQADGFNVDGKWDIVLSSHTIEHVDDPNQFLQKLTSIASKYVVVAYPYEEGDLISEHKNRISYHLLTKNGFWDIFTYKSNHWFNSMCCIAIKKVV